MSNDATRAGSQRAPAGPPLEITKDTRVSDILSRYGDIADVMEAFGIERVGPLSLRRVLGRFLTVERAARIHRVPLDELLRMLRTAIASVERRRADSEVRS